jgi:hypothetical protein
MSDPWNDSQAQEFITHVRAELVPMIDQSQFFVTLTPSDPDEIDVKFSVELGVAIMLDKPIIAVISPGSKMPPKLALVADHIIDVDLRSPDGPAIIAERIKTIMDQESNNAAIGTADG